MKRFYIITTVAALLASAATLPWSANAQTGGGGGGGASGGGGTSGSGATSGAGAGTAGAAGTAAGTSGTSGAPGSGTTGQTGAAGTAGTNPGTPGTTNAGVTGGAGAAAVQNPTGTAQPGANVGAAGQARLRAGQNQAGATINAQGQTSNTIPPVANQRPFFTNPQVQRELGLNQNQINQLNLAHQNALNRFNQSVAGLDANLTPQQRALRMQQFQNQFNTDFGGNLDTTFTDPRMMQRFNQLNLQSQGFNAFLNPTIQRELNLSPQQRTQLRQLANQWRQQMNDLRMDSRFIADDPQTWPPQLNELKGQFGQQLNNILNPQQQQQWAALTGAPFNFPPNGFAPNSDPRVQARSQNNAGRGTTRVPQTAVPQTGATPQPQQQIR